MSIPVGVRAFGPLATHVEGFRVRLALWGYSPSSRAVHLRLMAHLSGWLDERGLQGSALTAAVVDAFVTERRAAGYVIARSSRSLGPLLEYLREVGAVPVPVPRQMATPVEAMLAAYSRYLAHERGLAVSTIERNTGLVRPFLADQMTGGQLLLEDLVAADVTAFVLALARRGNASPATVARTGTALRSLLRFLHREGVTNQPLAEAVPAAASWKLAGLPKYLESEQVAALLTSCDQGTGVGRRDFAMLTVLVRLGLRAGELAALRLEDIDWHRAEVMIRGKGNRQERLPLPSDVGVAVVSYLTADRTALATVREVFIGARAPHRALTSGAVTQVVARAACRCGLGSIFAHRLRHSAATGMLRAGASLDEVGQVLRHRHPLTTAIYAKVDRDALRTLARPWPGAVS